jgi:FtsH-binding integral membrane protein
MSFNQPVIPSAISDPKIEELFYTVMQRVYLWMCIGLFVTAGVAAVVMSGATLHLIRQNPALLIGLLVAELALVLGLSLGINKLSPATAQALFVVYAALNGATLAVVVALYTMSSVAVAFGATASLFGVMTILGYRTKIDLTKFGGILLIGLIGLIIASVINLFLANTLLDWILTYVGILLFLGLTVYDTQRIKKQMLAALNQGNEDIVGRIGILGALSLYLDFINLFLRLLRILGKRR